MKIGILGPGNIAAMMAKTIVGLDGAEPYAIASRNLDKAKAFADQYGFEKAYGSYEDLVSDPEVELIYVSTPHSHHYEHMKLCLKNGKPVLSEKAFTVNAKQAKEVIELAESKKLLVAEAIWTRYMPLRYKLDEILESGIIGEISSITANLGYLIKDVPRLVDPNLAGGALLDVGVYTLNFAAMVIKDKIKKLDSTVVLGKHGLDEQESITISYESGKLAILQASMLAQTDRRGMIYGKKGYIELQNINNCEGIDVFDAKGERVAHYDQPKQITGFEYELQECMDAIKNGELECKSMPHAEIIRIIEMMDELRHQWGIKYPFE